MFRNYIKIAWRSLMKYRFYTLVNIIGLAAGLAFTFLIGGYAWNELQVNSQVRNVKNQYIIQSKWKDPNIGYAIATIGPLAKALRTEYPNLVKNYYRFDGITATVSRGDKHFREVLQIGDSTMLTMFGFPILYGNEKTALIAPFSIVITASKALKYFGRTEVVGQTLTLESFSNTKHDFLITAVLKDVPYNTITQLSKGYESGIFLPVSAMDFFGRSNIEQWSNIYIASYIELQQGVQPKDLMIPIAQLVRQNASPFIGSNFTPQLISLKQYYLEANNGIVKKMLFTLSGIALFILLMAVINFVNISTSRSGARMREIGVRKVMGGQCKQLILQFLTESILLTSCATLLAIVLYAVLRNYFGAVVGKEIPSFEAYPAYFILVPLAIALIVGLLAGLYPALVFSSLKTVDSLKGKLIVPGETIPLRKALVGFQFSIAAIVFIGALVISQQISLFFNSDLGYNKDFIISAKTPRDWSPAGVQHMEALRSEFEKLPQVQSASLSYEVPDGNNSGSFQLYRFGADSSSAISVMQLTADENYASLYQIPMRAGIFFKTPYHPVDSSKIVINETAAKALGWQDAAEAIGKQLRTPGTPFVFTVSGVTRDFHFTTMQSDIAPMVFLHVRFGTIYRLFSFKLKPGNIADDITAVQKKWDALFPDTPFEYTFMDDNLKTVYQTELQLKKASYAAAALALVIVLLGVVGLISLSLQKRTKEIGIRKILGAPVSGIVSLFLKEFLYIMAIAGVAACPVAFLIMRYWLNNYAYRIPLTMQPFMIAILVLAVITAALISLQTVKAALDSPVKSLRTE